MQVVRALGDGALGLVSPMAEDRRKDSSSNPAPPSNAIDAHQGRATPVVAGWVGQQGGSSSSVPGGGEENSGPGVDSACALSTPSAEHSRRWRDIDRLLVSAVPANSMPPPPHSSKMTHGGVDGIAGADGRTDREPGVVVGGLSGTASPAASSAAAAMPARSAAAAAAAERYPLLFAATRANEDVMMAAARLVASEGEGEGDCGGGDAPALVQQAVTFLEQEIGGSEDEGASVWQADLVFREGTRT